MNTHNEVISEYHPILGWSDIQIRGWRLVTSGMDDVVHAGCGVQLVRCCSSVAGIMRYALPGIRCCGSRCTGGAHQRALLVLVSCYHHSPLVVVLW